MKKTRKISLDEVIDSLYESDSSGDDDWVNFLISSIKKYDNWELVKLDPKETDGGLPQDDERVDEYFELPIKTMPPIVVVPKDKKDRGRHKYSIVDGSHRAWVARMKNKKILTYRPMDLNEN